MPGCTCGHGSAPPTAWLATGGLNERRDAQGSLTSRWESLGFYALAPEAAGFFEGDPRTLGIKGGITTLCVWSMRSLQTFRVTEYGLSAKGEANLQTHGRARRSASARAPASQLVVARASLHPLAPVYVTVYATVYATVCCQWAAHLGDPARSRPPQAPSAATNPAATNAATNAATSAATSALPTRPHWQTAPAGAAACSSSRAAR